MLSQVFRSMVRRGGAVRQGPQLVSSPGFCTLVARREPHVYAKHSEPFSFLTTCFSVELDYAAGALDVEAPRSCWVSSVCTSEQFLGWDVPRCLDCVPAFVPAHATRPDVKLTLLPPPVVHCRPFQQDSGDTLPNLSLRGTILVRARTGARTGSGEAGRDSRRPFSL